MCQGVKDTVFCTEAMMAVPVKILSVWMGFLYTEVSNVLYGSRETKVSKKEMDLYHAGNLCGELYI